MNDDFNTESKECWSIASEGDLNSWVLFDEVLTFDEANSTLDYDSSSAGTGVIYKEISIDELSESSSFELVFHLKSVGDTFVTDDAVVAAISGSISWAGFMTEPAIEFIVSTRSGFNPSCQYNYWASGMGAGQTGTGSYDCSAIASDIYFKAIGDSSGVTFQVSPDGTNYENFTSTTGSLPASAFELFSLFDEFYTLLWFGNNSGVNLTTNIDSIVLTGFSATGQY